MLTPTSARDCRADNPPDGAMGLVYVASSKSEQLVWNAKMKEIKKQGRGKGEGRKGRQGDEGHRRREGHRAREGDEGHRREEHGAREKQVPGLASG